MMIDVFHLAKARQQAMSARGVTSIHLVIPSRKASLLRFAPRGPRDIVERVEWPADYFVVILAERHVTYTLLHGDEDLAFNADVFVKGDQVEFERPRIVHVDGAAPPFPPDGIIVGLENGSIAMALNRLANFVGTAIQGEFFDHLREAATGTEEAFEARLAVPLSQLTPGLIRPCWMSTNNWRPTPPTSGVSLSAGTICLSITSTHPPRRMRPGCRSHPNPRHLPMSIHHPSSQSFTAVKNSPVG